MSNTQELKPVNQKKWIIITTVLTVIVVALSILAIYFYVKLKENTAQNNQAKVQEVAENKEVLPKDSNQGIKPPEINTPELLPQTPEKLNSANSKNLPFLYAEGFGYSKLINTDRVMGDDEVNRVDFTKFFDKNGTEIDLPFKDKVSKILENNGTYYLTFEQKYKQIGIWEPSQNKFELKETPVEFYDAQVLQNRIYLTEFDTKGDEGNNKCGKADDEIGKCKIYELDPVSWKSTEFITAVKPGFYGGTNNSLLDFDDKYIWLGEFFGDGGAVSESFLQFDIKTKKLIQTITINGNYAAGTSETLSITKPSKKSVDIASLNCKVDEEGKDLCDPNEQKNFDDKKFSLIPEKIYNLTIQTEETSFTCGDFNYNSERRFNNEQNLGEPVQFKDKNILNLKGVSINKVKCIK